MYVDMYIWNHIPACMYVCMCLCVRVCVFPCLYVCMLVCVCVWHIQNPNFANVEVYMTLILHWPSRTKQTLDGAPITLYQQTSTSYSTQSTQYFRAQSGIRPSRLQIQICVVHAGTRTQTHPRNSFMANIDLREEQENFVMEMFYGPQSGIRGNPFTFTVYCNSSKRLCWESNPGSPVY